MSIILHSVQHVHYKTMAYGLRQKKKFKLTINLLPLAIKPQSRTVTSIIIEHIDNITSVEFNVSCIKIDTATK